MEVLSSLTTTGLKTILVSLYSKAIDGVFFKILLSYKTAIRPLKYYCSIIPKMDLGAPLTNTHLEAIFAKNLHHSSLRQSHDAELHEEQHDFIGFSSEKPCHMSSCRKALITKFSVPFFLGFFATFLVLPNTCHCLNVSNRSSHRSVFVSRLWRHLLWLCTRRWIISYGWYKLAEHTDNDEFRRCSQMTNSEHSKRDFCFRSPVRRRRKRCRFIGGHFWWYPKSAEHWDYNWFTAGCKKGDILACP